MVSFTKGEIMAEQLERIEQRLERVERSVVDVVGTVDALSHRMEEASEQTSVSFAAQREYTEFAFARLRTEMLAGFGDVSRRFDIIDQRFDGLDGRLARVERKLDQFIDVQRATNQLVERRLNALESSPDR